MALLETIIIGGIIGAILKGGAGDDDDAQDAGIDEKKSETKGASVKKFPAGKPKAPPAITFNHKDAPSVRLQFTLLGYANNQYSLTMPKNAPFVKQFQRDYNSVAGACLNEAFCSPAGAEKAKKMGKLSIDGTPGPNTTNGLEWAKRIQGLTGETWQSLTAQAHLAGY